MNKTAILTVQDFFELTNSEIGQSALLYKKLCQQQIPLPNVHLLTIKTLQQIAVFNRLENKIDQLIDKINLQDKNLVERITDKIKNLIAYQQYPPQLATELQKFHQQKIDKKFVSVTASFINQNQDKKVTQDNVLGDANMLDSILQIWAESITNDEIINHNIFPAAIIIQIQNQEEISGIAYSLNPQSSQKNIVIQAVHGVFNEEQKLVSDYFEIQPSSWQIKSYQINRQATKLIRINDDLEEKKLSKKLAETETLSKKEAIKLAKLVQKIKQSNLNQIKVSWSKYQNKFYINDVENFFPTQQEQNKKLVCIGETVVGGVIEAQAKIVSRKKDLKNFRLGQIAIVKTLNKTNIDLIKQASAIICQDYIRDQHIFQELKINKRACIVKANYACDKIQDGNHLLVDASNGKIYLQSQSTQNKISQQLSSLKHTFTKIFPFINNYYNYQISDQFDNSLILNTDPLFLENEIHPLLIIRGKKRNLLVKQFTNKIKDLIQNSQQLGKFDSIIYRINNLTSADLSKLKKSFGLEIKEPNPSLGFRGGLRNISNFDLINFELDVIRQLRQKLPGQIKILIPFIRSPIELKMVKQHINNYLEKTPSVWMQADTPENIDNLTQYLRQGIEGILVNLEQIYHTYCGIDADNPDITRLYPINEKISHQLIEQITTAIKKFETEQEKNSIPKLIINLPEFHPGIINVCHQHHVYALSIKRKFIKQTKNYIMKLEGKNYVND